jgi:hypothetical protein
MVAGCDGLLDAPGILTALESLLLLLLPFRCGPKESSAALDCPRADRQLLNQRVVLRLVCATVA